MSREFEFRERNAATRDNWLISAGKRAGCKADRIKLLVGENGLAIALVIADFDPQVSVVRYRQDLQKTNLDCNLRPPRGPAVGSAAEFDPRRA